MVGYGCYVRVVLGCNMFLLAAKFDKQRLQNTAVAVNVTQW